MDSVTATGYRWLDIVLLACGVIAALGGAYGVLSKCVFPFFRKLGDFLDDWEGEPARPGVPERLGVMARLERNETAMREVRHEVKPNGGSSIKDAVTRTETKLDRTESKLDDHIEHSQQVLVKGQATEAELRGAVARLSSAVDNLSRDATTE